MHTKLTIFLSILLFLGSCQAHMPLTTPESSSVEGQINLYFSTKSLSPPNITFTLKKIEVEERENEEWFTLFEGKKEINSIDLISRQIFLSESYLPVGKYVRMKATITEASVTRGEKQFSLALPPNDGAVILPVRFQIFKRESSALFLNWNPENSIVDTYLFQPTFILNPQKIGIKELLLYVTNRGSDNVTVINRKSDQVVGTIGVDKDPMGIVSSPSGNEIYIANADSNTISIIDTSHHKVVDTISLNFGISPRELAVSPDGQRLYVSNFHSNNVSIIDTIGKNLLGQATVGNNPLGIAVNVRGDRIYVVNSTSNNLSVIDPFSKEVISTIGVGSNPTDVMIYDEHIFVANAGSNNIYQISIKSFGIEKEITAGFGSHRVALGLMNRIYVANRNSNDISIIPSSMSMAIQRIAVGDLPQEMVIDRERRKLYVANEGTNTVSVIDLVREKLIGSIPVGKQPYGLALIE